MSGEQLAEARRYRRLGLICGLADRAVDVVFLAGAALLAARPLDAWLQSWPSLEQAAWLRLIAFCLILTAASVVVSAPLSYYSGFVLEHRFALSTLSRAGWLWRHTKVLSLAVPFGLAMWLGLFWIIRWTGSWWWLAGAGAFFLLSVVLTRIYPVLIEPLFYTIERLHRPDIEERLARLVQGTGLAIEGIYRIALSEETKKANAHLAGLGRTRRVLLGDTLLDQFTAEEIEVVFAHEVGHHVFRHLRKLLVVGMASSAAGFWISDGVLRRWVAWWEGTLDYAALPVYAMPMLLLVLMIFGLVLGPLQCAVSRHFERQSDRYALMRTGLADAYRSAFCKLAQQNKDDPDPPRLEVLLFRTHPAIAERLAIAAPSGDERKPAAQ